MKHNSWMFTPITDLLFWVFSHLPHNNVRWAAMRVVIAVEEFEYIVLDKAEGIYLKLRGAFIKAVQAADNKYTRTAKTVKRCLGWEKPEQKKKSTKPRRKKKAGK